MDEQKRFDEDLTYKGPQSNSKSPSGLLTPARGLAIGTIVREQYKVLSFLGQGAMGMVYKVEHIFLHKIGAMKTVSPASRQSFRRFQIEAQAASRLDHPNLVKAVDFGPINERQWCFVMEYVEGETLSDTLKRMTRIDLTTALQIFIPISLALGYAHDQGVIHRDLKPHNIVLVPPESGDEVIPKIVDFGIAKFDFGEGEELTKTGEVFGTPLYMSPEQCSGVSVDNRSDIYSLGCVLFEVLTGAAPFRGATAMQTMMMHRTEEMPPLKEASLGVEFPPLIEEVLRRMLAKEPADRYQNCSDVAADLISIQQGHSDLKPTVRSGNVPSRKTIAKPEHSRKQGMLIGLLSTLVVSLLGIIGFLLFNNHRDLHLSQPVPPAVQQQRKATAEHATKEQNENEVNYSVLTTLSSPKELIKKEILESKAINRFYVVHKLQIEDDYLKPLKSRDNIESLSLDGQHHLTDKCAVLQAFAAKGAEHG